MDEPDPLEWLREQACDLARTGRYPGWPEIVTALHKGVHPLLVARLTKDGEFVSMINTRCGLAMRMRGA
jgi:hypothetical protein